MNPDPVGFMSKASRMTVSSTGVVSMSFYRDDDECLTPMVAFSWSMSVSDLRTVFSSPQAASAFLERVRSLPRVMVSDSSVVIHSYGHEDLKELVYSDWVSICARFTEEAVIAETAEDAEAVVEG